MKDSNLTPVDNLIPAGAKKLTPLQMNSIAILKAHTVITIPSAGKGK